MFNEISKNLHIAKVIDNNDPNKQGLIKIYISYMHLDIKEDLLPWALPFHNFIGGASTYGISSIPEINSYIWVFFEDEDHHKNPFYFGDVVNEDLTPNKLFEDNVKSAIAAESAYPNVKFIYTPNGICIGFSTESGKPEFFIYHPKFYMFVDKNGKTTFKNTGGAEIIISDAGEISIKAGTATLEASVLGETLKGFMEQILDGISALTVTCAAPGSPSSPPVNTATFVAIKAQLATMLSQKVKNN